MARSRWISAAVLIAGWCAFLVYAYPGQLSRDSLDQLAEARSGFYTDAHPPVMQLVWSLAERIVTGPLGMLVVQSAAFSIGAFVLLARVLSPVRAALCAAGLLLFPPVMTVMAVVWKDSMMAGLLLLGVALVVARRRAVRLAGLAVIGLAAAMRHNGAAASLPLVVLLFEWPARRRIPIAIGAWLAITVAGFAGNAALADRHVVLWHSTVALHDIAGTYLDAGQITDRELSDELAGTGLVVDRELYAAMERGYRVRNFGSLVQKPTGLWDFAPGGAEPTPPQREAIARAWRRVVGSHPIAYLDHRTHVFAAAIGAYTWGPVTRSRDSALVADLHLVVVDRPIARAWAGAMAWLAASTPLFWPWLYLIANVGLALGCRRRRDVVALAASGLLLEATLFFLVATPDFRYSHWMIATTCLAAIVALARTRPHITS